MFDVRALATRGGKHRATSAVGNRPSPLAPVKQSNQLRGRRGAATATRLVALCMLLVISAEGCASLPVVGSGRVAEQWAFTAPWDTRSTSSLLAHSAALDAAILEWIPLDSLSGQPMTPYPDSLSPKLPSSLRRMALVTSYTGDHFN